MNTPVRLLSLFIIFIYGAFVPADIMAETRNLPAVTVVGIVTDQEGEPLIGVNIQVRGSSKGTATDFDGRFTLEDIDENVVLVISYVGYQTQEVPVAGKSNLDIVMVSDSKLLDEVVITALGIEREEKSLGYAVQKYPSITPHSIAVRISFYLREIVCAVTS